MTLILTPERRAVSTREFRVSRTAPTIRRDESGRPMVEGYAAVFYSPDDSGTEYPLWPDMIERIDPKCFDRALAEKHPCRCLTNHDPNWMLGRCDKGTLSLKVDSRGLHYSCPLPDSHAGNETAKNLELGNLDGSSFSFDVLAQRWEDIRQPSGDWISYRYITDVRLYDVGPVCFPAYTSTSAGLRSESLEEVLSARDEWRRQRQRNESEEIEVATRLVEIRTLEL